MYGYYDIGEEESSLRNVAGDLATRGFVRIFTYNMKRESTKIKVMKDLNIGQFQNITRVGQIIEGTKLVKSKKYILYPTTLNLKWDNNFELQKECLSIVYIFTVDGIITKIGKTDGNGGIAAGLSFYLNAGTDDPGLNRFVINRFMRDAIEQDQKVEVYMFYLTMYLVSLVSLRWLL